MARWSWPAVAALLLFTHPSWAFWYEGPKKFNFLPLQSAQKFSNISTNTCATTLAAYTKEWDAQRNVTQIKATCAIHQECILDNSGEGQKAYMATASIVLSLAPILLSTAGPTLSEIGLLSLERPILAGLVTLGTAAVYPSRVLGHEDDSARRLLKRRYRFTQSTVQVLSNPRYKYLVSLLQYLLVLGAVVNVLSASWQLGVGSVVTFRCSISLLPLVWVLAPAVIHWFTSLAFNIHRRRQRGPRKGRGFFRLLLVELSPCMTHGPLPPGTVDQNTLVMIFHGWSALLGFLHVMFGILIFSSLLFTMIIDAAAVLFRYFASVLVCRAVLIIELEGMRYVHQQRGSKALLRSNAPTFVSVSKGSFSGGRSELDDRLHSGNSEQTLFHPSPSFSIEPPTPFLPRPGHDEPKLRSTYDGRSPSTQLPPRLSVDSPSRSSPIPTWSSHSPRYTPRPSPDNQPPPPFSHRASRPALAPASPRLGRGYAYTPGTSTSTSRSSSCSPSRAERTMDGNRGRGWNSIHQSRGAPRSASYGPNEQRHGA